MKLRPKFLLMGFVLAFAATAAFAQPTNLNSIGSFEGSMPAFWNVGNTGGATLTWATDQHRSGLRSLKIEKTTTGDSASFVSDNMCDIWSRTHSKNVDIFLGAWVRTQGVNTTPATEDAKWYIVHEFYDSAGVKIGDVQAADPADVASTGAWVADTSMPGRCDSAEGLLADDRQVRGRKECDRNGVGGRLHVLRSCGTVGRPELGIEPGISRRAGTTGCRRSAGTTES